MVAKPYKFEICENIPPQNVKCHQIIYQIIYQTKTLIYKAAKVISTYLKPLCQNKYSISDTQQYLDMLSNFPPLIDDKEDVTYNVESFLTNNPIKDTI